MYKRRNAGDWTGRVKIWFDIVFNPALPPDDLHDPRGAWALVAS
jgi:hypothetical protein